MKTAIIYYSYDGNTAFAAEAIKAATGADIYEIKTVDTKKRTGPWKIIWGGFQVIRNKMPPLEPLSVDIKDYDNIILGTPVWAGSPAPAMVSFLSKTKISGKKIALFCCHAGSKGEVFNKLKALLAGNEFAGEIDFKNAAKENPAALPAKIDEWINKLR